MKLLYHLLVVACLSLPFNSWSQCNVPVGLSTGSITTINAVAIWAPQAGVDTFKLRYAELGTGAWTQRNILNNPATNSFYISGLYPGVTYEWQVKAICGASSSGYGPTVIFTTPWGYMPCVRPTLTSTANISNSSATLMWDTLVSADTFKIRFGVLGTNVFTWRNVPGAPNLIGYELTNLAPNTTYEWKVQSVCNGVASSYSNQNVFTTTFGPTPCGKPYNVRIGDITSTSAKLVWSGNVTGDQFRCRYAVSSANPVWQYKTVSGLPNVTSMTLTGLNPNTPYIFQLQTLCLGVTIGYGPQYAFNVHPLRIGAFDLQTSSIVDLEQDKLYPNPAKDEIFIRFNPGDDAKYTIRIYDLIGKERVLISEKGQMPGIVEKRIDTAALPKGIYFAELNVNGKLKQYRFVIDK